MSALAQVTFHTGLVNGLKHLAGGAQLKRGSDGTAAFPYVMRRKRPNFQILTFHRLTRRQDPFFPALPMEVFCRQVKYLARHYQIVDLAQLLRRLRNQEPIPRNAVALTFDDGYRDNFDLAFPILKQFGVPMTLFLTTGFLNREDLLWNDKVCFALKHTRKRQVELSCDRGKCYMLGTEEQRLRAAAELLWFLRHVPHDERDRSIDELQALLGIQDFDYLWNNMLSWEQVRTMYHHGIRFGSHTVSHPILSRLPLAQAREEIVNSKVAIQNELGAAVELFAFPVGTTADFNVGLCAVVREAGFLGAVTTVFGTNTALSDPYALRRIGTLEYPRIGDFASRHCWYKFAA
jgi:peptidoglycan/xylan/chitin deacetylase (PgdA/CDA1 family)